MSGKFTIMVSKGIDDIKMTFASEGKDFLRVVLAAEQYEYEGLLQAMDTLGLPRISWVDSDYTTFGGLTRDD